MQLWLYKFLLCCWRLISKYAWQKKNAPGLVKMFSYRSGSLRYWKEIEKGILIKKKRKQSLWVWSIDLERPGAKIRKLMERDLMNMTNSYPSGQLETTAEYFLFSCLHCIFCFSHLSDKPTFSFRSVGKESTFGKDTTTSVPFYSQGFFVLTFKFVDHVVPFHAYQVVIATQRIRAVHVIGLVSVLASPTLSPILNPKILLSWNGFRQQNKLYSQGLWRFSIVPDVFVTVPDMSFFPQ